MADGSVSQFLSYEEYLDSQIKEIDEFYLEVRTVGSYRFSAYFLHSLSCGSSNKQQIHTLFLSLSLSLTCSAATFLSI